MKGKKQEKGKTLIRRSHVYKENILGFKLLV